jgi:hypothetical protein
MKRKGKFMHRWLAAVALTFAIPMAASAALVITEVNPGVVAGTPGAINGDWWELTNTGPAPVDLIGYQWADSEDALPSDNSNFFPSYLIGVNESIIILEESSANEAAWLANWGLEPGSVTILGTNEMVDDATPDGDTYSGLGGGGDTVNIYTPAGVLLDSFSYGPATNGTSFWGDRLGNVRGLSVPGEMGAYQEQNFGNIGSPGVVPEPTTVLMALFATAIAGCFRRVR